MTPKQLRAFLAVAETLSFAQASERLHLSQPALSLSIKSLETHLGGPLLVRTTRSVALTPEGDLLVPLARNLLADWANAEDQLRQHFTLQRGSLSVAAMPAFAANRLPAALAEFRRLYPNINVAVHDVINEQVHEMVRTRRVELGIGFEPLALDGLVFEPLYVDRFVAVVPADSPLARQDELSWAQLLAEPFITLQRPSAVRWMIEQAVGSLPVAFESHQLQTVGNMVAQGLGVSAVPALCQEQMQRLGACCRRLHAPVLERPVGVVRLAGLAESSAARALSRALSHGQEASLAAPSEGMPPMATQ